MGTEATIVLFTAFACLSAELFCALAAAEFGDQPHGRRFAMAAAGAVSLAAAAGFRLINLGARKCSLRRSATRVREFFGN